VTARGRVGARAVWEDGVEALDRTLFAQRRTDVDLLAEAIETGGRNRVSEEALVFAARLLGDGSMKPTIAATSRPSRPGDRGDRGDRGGRRR